MAEKLQKLRIFWWLSPSKCFGDLCNYEGPSEVAVQSIFKIQTFQSYFNKEGITRNLIPYLRKFHTTLLPRLKPLFSDEIDEILPFRDR